MEQNNKGQTYYVYVLDKKGHPMMPTKRYGKVRRLLKEKKAVVVERKPFTIRLKYEPDTNEIQELIAGIDPGRTNIGISVIRENGTELFSAICETRNKEIPKLMKDRAAHRRASRRGERLARKRLAKKLGTTTTKFLMGRMLPGYDAPVMLKDIINTESRFNNRKRPDNWLTPTATQLLRTHLNLVKRIQKILPIKSVVLETNRFAFMKMDDPNTQGQQYQQGPLYGKASVEVAVYEQQEGLCLLCKKKPIEHYHHVVPRSRNGSETLANRVGLCEHCHELVHKDAKAAEKLSKQHTKLKKKYGALSVLNQIIPFLLTELKKQFPGNVHTTQGYITKQFREDHKLEKDHNLDAYCIACSIKQKGIRISFSTAYQILQFRRHDRASIKSQTERVYQLNGVIVARNRRKRMDQKEDSLHEWYLKTKKLYGKKRARELEQMLTVTKSYRRYNNPTRILPGAIFEYKGTYHFLSGQLTNGAYFRAAEDADKKNYPARDCRIIRPNTGLVFLQ